MAAGVVVGGVFLPRDELLRVEERPVRSRANLVHDGRFEVDKHYARNVLSGARLAEEGVERVIAYPKCSVRGHQSVRLNPVLEAVQLPARVAHLTASLADVDGYNLAHLPVERSLGEDRAVGQVKSSVRVTVSFVQIPARAAYAWSLHDHVNHMRMRICTISNL